jgi:mono/diheme cytochrome c family protein
MKFLSLLVCLSIPTAVFANPEGVEFFQKKIQPILTDHCYKCHSHSGDKIKGGLVVDSLSGLTSGGDTGPAVVPGNPAKSLLIEAVSYKNDDLQMPPKGKKLSDEQIAALTEWVKMGAPWPEEHGQKMATRPKGKITDEDRQWWAFQPVAKVQPPAANGWGANELDSFIHQRLTAEGLQPAPSAPPEQLVRRIYFDIIGLPPTPDDVNDFVQRAKVDRAGAVKQLAEKLLASPRYGERWARYWLDLVRYAESDGYRVDDYRPNAWRYRDYVIRSINADKPYNRFVQEQLAGDELWPDDPEARTATGYLTHWIYEYNNRDAATQWTTILNDLTDTTADVFLGMGVQCARCHDHKFDPILQKDYFRLQAFFAPILPYAEGVVASAEERAAYDKKLAEYEAKTGDLLRKLSELEKPFREHAAEDAITKFPPETQAIIRKPANERTPYEQQITELAWRQVDYEYLEKRFAARVKEPAKSQRIALLAQLKQFEKDKPQPLPVAQQAADVGPLAPPVTIPKKAQMGEIAPGFLSVIDEKPAAIATNYKNSTGRRTALAQWLTRADNPLTARVIVNRVWQYHFGRGLAYNASDFGKLGEKPSHPELLDWLTNWFIENGWSLKKLNELIVTSATFQQSTTNPIAEQARLKDPENRLLWRANTHRLDAEQIRDAVLSVTGELDLTAGGEGVDASKPRRTIYNKVIRNTRDPVLDVFDAPEGFASMAQRNTTTTPTQSLLMINSKWSLARARAFANRLKKENSTDEGEIAAEAYRLAFGREPQPNEIAAAKQFLGKQINVVSAKAPASAEAAPFVGEKMAFRDGRAAQFAPGSAQQRLTVPVSPTFPKGDFTVEAFITLKSIYDSGSVRTIVSQWDGNKGHPGWSLGVTGKGSRYKPQTLVLQLTGDQSANDFDGTDRIFSGLHIELGRPYFVAVTVNLDDATEKGITFYAKDLSNDDEPLQAVNISHKVTSGIHGPGPLAIGATALQNNAIFDGLIDDVRLSSVPLRAEQLLFTSAGVNEHTVGYWKFENDPGPYEDSSPRGNDISAAAVTGPQEDPRFGALVDFCHVLLNSNEFLYVD